MTAAYTHSQNKQTDTAVAGYMSGDKFEELVRTGAYNPFRLQSGAAAILAPAVLHGVLQTTRSKIDVASASASRDTFAMGGGTAMLGTGIDFTRQEFKDDPSQILRGPGPGNPGWTDVIIGGGTGSQALDASRTNWGAFSELLMPISKKLEATAAVRYMTAMPRSTRKMSATTSTAWPAIPAASATTPPRPPSSCRPAGPRSRRCWCAAPTAPASRRRP
ncbi:TonB-dependent receptor [Massilia sp. H-1]|nr:TonB-dependent receptor [Massilia sp. H-1]